jgi:ADP-ribosylglycohydrolase
MKAWEHEYTFRKSLNPSDYQGKETEWGLLDSILESRKEHLFFLWESNVPGSLAPDSLFYTAVQAWENQGHDVSEAVSLLPLAVEARKNKDWGVLELLSGRIFRALYDAPKDPDHLFHKFSLPKGWEDILSAMPCRTGCYEYDGEDKADRVYHGWVAQICGGSYGTALEGYTTENLIKAFGEKLDAYVTEPETYNDDITFQIALLSAVERLCDGQEFTSDTIADEWLRLIFFGWSAEYYALENLRRGIYPPESGSFRNAYSEWIGAQMRTMVCGLLAPGDPVKAARLAWLDSRVSHTGNGIYAGIHSAAMTSLAFIIDDPRELLRESRNCIPADTLFLHYFDMAMHTAENSADHLEAWRKMESDLKQYHWIHALPNLAAVVLSLWFCESDLTKAFRILGECGLDVDCNAGEVGTILGVMNNKVPAKWADPIGDTLKTYVPGYEEMSIRDLAAWTVKLGQKL